MPTKREREYYRMGFRDGSQERIAAYGMGRMKLPLSQLEFRDELSQAPSRRSTRPKRKLSAWNKYIKNKRNHIKYRDGKLNLKKMAVAFRRKQRR
jgi:hypothetical protein